MADALTGRRVLLTGCTANIGLATAELFAREGAAVAMVDVHSGVRAAADRITGEFPGTKVVPYVADVAAEDQVSQLIDDVVAGFGGIDIVVSNAGIQRAAAVTEMTVQDWDATMAVNVRGPFLLAKHALPHLEASGHGVMVITSSIAGIHGPPGLTGYSASKGAIIAFTKALAGEIASKKVRVNALCPGWVDTSFNTPAISFMGGQTALEAAVVSAVPLGRQGRPDEMAQAMLFLASDASTYMTGQVLVVDGGIT